MDRRTAYHTLGLPNYASNCHPRNPIFLNLWAAAVIPAEIGVPLGRVQNVIPKDNEDEMRLNLDLLEQRREEAAIRMAKYKGQVARHYNVRVRSLFFIPEDLVLRKNAVSRVLGTNKLGPNWKGPSGEGSRLSRVLQVSPFQWRRSLTNLA